MSSRTDAGALALACLAAACGPSPNSGANAGPLPAPAAAGFPRTLELPAGPLEIARPPVRVVPVNAGAVDLVTALIGPERVAGMPGQALRYSRLAVDPGPFAGLTRFTEYRAEPVLGLAPDLVVCDRWGSVETTARLREAGIAVLELEDANSLAAVEASIALLGRALGVEQRAEELATELEQRRAALESRTRARPRYGALVYSNYGTQGSTAGAGTTMDEVLRLANLRNLAAETGRQGHVALTFEELLALDPDLIVVGERAQGEGTGGAEVYLRSESALAGLRAVREGRIVALPVRLFSSTSQEILTGAEMLSARVDALAPSAAGGIR